MLGTSITFMVIKYVSLNFTTVTRNLTPLITIFIGAWLLGTKIKIFDLFVSFVSLIGVILIIIGFSSIEINEADQIVTKDDLNSKIAF
jgi:drug/metabolite transporter (DMT)-like permease